MILELRLDLTVLTPLFLGDADQQASLRAPGIKGPLRWWYRAADPRFAEAWPEGTQVTREDRLFGGVRPGAGQSPFLLRIESGAPPLVDWKSMSPQRFNRGQGRNTQNGLIYLGYPFGLRTNEGRTAIAPGHRFQVRCVLAVKGSPKQDQAPEQIVDLRRALAASWWLLCHLGGLGSRSRRGFGNLALTAWECKGGEWPELDDLPLVAAAPDIEAADAALHAGLERIRQWFPADSGNKEPARHPHLGAQSRWTLLDNGQERWDAALAEAGTRLQTFRLRRAPDYQMVKDHVLFRRDRGRGGRPMRATPDRTSFGLPLTFRFTSVEAPPLTLVPYDAGGGGHFERQGSLLLLRLLPVGGRLHPLFVRMAGAVPGEDPPVVVREDARDGSRGASRQEARHLEPFAANAMDRFMDSLVGGSTRG